MYPQLTVVMNLNLNFEFIYASEIIWGLTWWGIIFYLYARPKKKWIPVIIYFVAGKLLVLCTEFKNKILWIFMQYCRHYWLCAKLLYGIDHMRRIHKAEPICKAYALSVIIKCCFGCFIAPRINVVNWLFHSNSTDTC